MEHNVNTNNTCEEINPGPSAGEQINVGTHVSLPEADPSVVNGTVISFHNVSYVVSSSYGLCYCYSSKRTILNDISGLLLPGLNAIMGPTGCGKSTLLDILAGRKDMTTVKGTILVNGYKQPKNFKCIAGYVVQDDVLLGTMIVKESIVFSANLRIRGNVTQNEKIAMVDKVLKDLDLQKCADTKIETELIRGVSGGERRRTCIAMELIVSSGILFLDEPTTGLDSSTANSVMSLLSRLAKQGLTIVITIHQPRYSIFKLINNLILLASGSIIFQGPSTDAIDFFKLQQYEIEEINPPDFFLDVINAEILSPSISSKLANSVPNDPFETLHKKEKVIDELSKKFKETCWFERVNERLQKEINSFAAGNQDQKAPHEKCQYATSLSAQLKYVARRSILNVVRNPAASISQVSVTLFFGFMVGMLYWDLSKKYPECIQNRCGAFFFIITIQLFGNLSAVEIFLKERVIFIHEIKSGFYRVSVFFFTKIFCDLIPLRVVPMFVFAVMTYWMIGLDSDLIKFGIYFFTLFITTVMAAILTFLISASVRVLALAHTFIGLVYIIMMVFGGFLVNLKSMTIWIRWIQYTSVVRFSLKALLINELADKEYEMYEPNGSLIFNRTYRGNDYLSEQGIDHQNLLDF